LDEWETARGWLIRAAEQGDPYGQYRLALTYIAGVDGNMWRFEESLKWLKKSAEQGFLPAQVSLGLGYWEGDIRTRKMAPDNAKALHWLRIAAERGDAKAKTYLGYAYAEGRGVVKDDVAAVQLWRAAAAQNYSRAEEALGWAYEKGRGVPRDPSEARRWYQRAASHGSHGAKSKLKSPEMTKLADRDIGTAILIGLLVLGIASAGSTDAAPVEEVQQGGGFMDVSDPFQLWGMIVMMDIK
jgi:TPR repeat protein